MAWLLRATLAAGSETARGTVYAMASGIGLALACGACSDEPRGGTPHPGCSEAIGSTSEAIQQCAAQTLEGIDVFDGQGPIDWSAVADGGIAFAMIKATQGTYDTQSTFAANWAGAERSGVRRGAYHFFDPTEDGAAQAQHFLAVVGPLEAIDLPPMLDIECPDGDADCLGTGASGASSADAIGQRMWAWIRGVEGATGRSPIVYTFASYFASSGVDAGGLEAYPLFIAYPTATACFPVPAPWTTAAMWQYAWTGTVSGVQGDVDRDRFLGASPVFAGFTGATLAPTAAPTVTRTADAAAPPPMDASPADAAPGAESASPDPGRVAGSGSDAAALGAGCL